MSSFTNIALKTWRKQLNISLGPPWNKLYVYICYKKKCTKMDNSQAIQKFNKLPDVLKAEVADFIDFLSEKVNKAPKGKKTEILNKGLGAWKGKIEISADFDDPLEDFKDYMPE